MRIRGLTIGVLVAGLLLVIPAALAKGPAGATIEGEGVKGKLVVDQPGEPGQGTAMSQLVERVGFFELAFGQGTASLAQPPTNDLGKQRLVITWDMGSDHTITQEVYHRAQGGPVTYIEPGQRFWDDSTKTAGGWYRVRGDIETPLVQLGVSPDAFAIPTEAKSVKDAGAEQVTKATSAPVAAPTLTTVAAPSGSTTPSGSTINGRVIAAIAVATAVLVVAVAAGTLTRRRRLMPH